jgi:hypothetical protein
MSTDKFLECILYAVVEKTKMGLNTEDIIKIAQNEVITLWTKDIKEIAHE